MTELLLIGCDHHTVLPSRLRAAASGQAEVESHLVEARAAGRIEGAFLLSTCNRIELLLDGDPEEARRVADEVLDGETPWSFHRGEDAIVRLLRIATGLESLVLGEEQILGQIARAFKAAEDAGLLSRSIHMLRSRLLSSARQLRASAPASGRVRSVAALGVHVVADAGPRIGVLGAGETARLALEMLRHRGVQATVIVNRTKARAEALASHFESTAMSLDEFDAAPPQLDALICAVDTTEPIVHARHVAGVSRIVDLSRPCVCDPAVREIEGLELIDLDVLTERTREQTEEQRCAADRLGAQVQGKAAVIFSQLEPGRAQLGQVVDLHIESALAEVEQAFRGKLKHLDDPDRDNIRDLMRRAAKRHAHYHLLDLRKLETR